MQRKEKIDSELDVKQWLIDKENDIKADELYLLISTTFLDEMILSNAKVSEALSIKKQELEIWRATYNL